MSEQVVIVTGAAKGIGAQVAKAYEANGAAVVLADMNEVNAKGRGTFVKTDVRDPNAIVHLMERTIENFGRIDVLINNAGKGQTKSPYDVTVDEWDDIMNTNLRSVFLCSREAAKYMKNNPNGGSIVNIASTRSLMSEPHTEAYAATKGGILSLTHALAASLAKDQITVNAISPGWIETEDYGQLRPIDHEQHLSGRVGKPDDIARACLYLTDPLNDFVTGINLVIDGGMTRKMIYEE